MKNPARELPSLRTARGRTLLASILLASLALPLTACSSSSPSGAGPSSSDGGTTKRADAGPGAVGAVGDACSASSPCGTGLTCATSGSLKGRCTADCTADLGLCAAKFGSAAVCMNAAQCARTCVSVSECPAASECTPLSGGVSACVPNPDGAPDAAPPPNGACTDLGGAFGDTVANGGYRCAHTSDGTISKAIEQCKNGVWTAAYTCTCQVTVGTVSDPSDCSDFKAAGTATCGYGLGTCAQCDPTAGCHSP